MCSPLNGWYRLLRIDIPGTYQPTREHEDSEHPCSECPTKAQLCYQAKKLIRRPLVERAKGPYT